MSDTVTIPLSRATWCAMRDAARVGVPALRRFTGDGWHSWFVTESADSLERFAALLDDVDGPDESVYGVAMASTEWVELSVSATRASVAINAAVWLVGDPAGPATAFAAPLLIFLKTGIERALRAPTPEELRT